MPASGSGDELAVLPPGYRPAVASEEDGAEVQPLSAAQVARSPGTANLCVYWLTRQHCHLCAILASAL